MALTWHRDGPYLRAANAEYRFRISSPEVDGFGPYTCEVYRYADERRDTASLVSLDAAKAYAEGWL